MKPTKVYYSENFEIYAFKHKTYGMEGLIEENETYAEAYAAAEKLVLKQCMEENPHLAFTNNGTPKKILKLDEPAFSGTDYMKHPSEDFRHFTPSEKINKEQIEKMSSSQNIYQTEPYNLTKEIESCKSLALLKVLLKTATTKEEKELCNKKLAELQKQTV